MGHEFCSVFTGPPLVAGLVRYYETIAFLCQKAVCCMHMSFFWKCSGKERPQPQARMRSCKRCHTASTLSEQLWLPVVTSTTQLHIHSPAPLTCMAINTVPSKIHPSYSSLASSDRLSKNLLPFLDCNAAIN